MKEEKKSEAKGAATDAARHEEPAGHAGAETPASAHRTAACEPDAPPASTEPGMNPSSGPVAERTVREPEPRSGKPFVPERRGFPTAVDLLVFLGIFLVANLLGSVVALLAGCPWPDTAAALSDDEAVRAAAQVSLAHFNAITYFVSMSLTLAGYLFYRSRRGGPRTVGRFSVKGLNPVLLLWGVLFMFATSVVLEPLLGLLPEVPNVYGRGVWAAVTLVVMAPLFEEVIFRGVLLESLRTRYGVIAAWLVSSLLFGLVHMHPTVVVNAFFMGLILGFIYLSTGSLWSSIFLHAVNNGISYVLLAAGLGSAMLIDLVGSRTLYVLIYIAAAAVFLVSGYMMLRTLRRMKAEEKNRAQA